MTDAQARLIAAGWVQTPDGRWTSPLTNRVYDEQGALSLERMTVRPRRSNRRHWSGRR